MDMLPFQKEYGYWPLDHNYVKMADALSRAEPLPARQQLSEADFMRWLRDMNASCCFGMPYYAASKMLWLARRLAAPAELREIWNPRGALREQANYYLWKVPGRRVLLAVTLDGVRVLDVAIKGKKVEALNLNPSQAEELNY